MSSKCITNASYQGYLIPLSIFTRYCAAIMLLNDKKRAEQWDYQNHRARKRFTKSRALLNVFHSPEVHLTIQSLWGGVSSVCSWEPDWWQMETEGFRSKAAEVCLECGVPERSVGRRCMEERLLLSGKFWEILTGDSIVEKDIFWKLPRWCFKYITSVSDYRGTILFFFHSLRANSITTVMLHYFISKLERTGSQWSYLIFVGNAQDGIGDDCFRRS